MTFNAKTHFKASLLEAMLRLHGTMALLAFDIAVDMPLMVEKNMLRHQIDLDPRRGRSGIEIPVFLFYPWMICYDIVVTMETLFHGWNPRMVGVTDIGMTIATFNFLHAGMHLMTERDGLLGAEIHLPVCIEIIHERSDEKSRAGGPE
jgi:hypothetical protein